jgi:hypothetical protein
VPSVRRRWLEGGSPCGNPATGTPPRLFRPPPSGVGPLSEPYPQRAAVRAAEFALKGGGSGCLRGRCLMAARAAVGSAGRQMFPRFPASVRKSLSLIYKHLARGTAPPRTFALSKRWMNLITPGIRAEFGCNGELCQVPAEGWRKIAIGSPRSPHRSRKMSLSASDKSSPPPTASDTPVFCSSTLDCAGKSERLDH